MKSGEEISEHLRHQILPKLASARAKATQARRSVGSPLEGHPFEQFVEELSASFVRAPVAEIGNHVDSWIKHIVLGHDLNRGALAQLDSISGKLVVRHSWSRGNLVRLPIGLEFAQPAPWFHGVLSERRTIIYSKISELPPEFFASDWKGYRRFVSKSNITVPLRVGGEVMGALGLATAKLREQ